MKVDDDQWRAFRQVALARGLSVSAYLGRLVTTELKRHGDRPVAALNVEEPERDRR